MEYQELIERLRYEGYDVSRNEAANAIESLLAENEQMKAELAKYRGAPVVAWQSSRNGFICKENKNPEYNKPLIVKPGEEK